MPLGLLETSKLTNADIVNNRSFAKLAAVHGPVTTFTFGFTSP
jgi:hypothetical protein